ncbi:MAG: cell division protein FtsL [Gemmatimonadota bacterium]|nr:cell division protein FtsL [Gemmatimonadota bacterium]
MNTGSETKTSGGYRYILLAMALVVLGLLGYLWAQAQTVRQGDEISRLRTEHQQLLRRQERLRAEISGLRRSSRIREIATVRLGMVFPQGPPQNLYMDLRPGRQTPSGHRN